MNFHGPSFAIQSFGLLAGTEVKAKNLEERLDYSNMQINKTFSSQQDFVVMNIKYAKYAFAALRHQ